MNIWKRVVRKLGRIFGFKAFVPSMVRKVSGDFEPLDAGISRRRYTDYDEYLRHQMEKADVYEAPIRAHDVEYEAIILERFRPLGLEGKSVLCLGARFGGEVRAFTRLGALAIGLDLNPGRDNLFVLPGDVHKLQFADSCFDVVYTNILDHIFDVEKFFQEIRRVLKPGGKAYFEVNLEKPTRYEAVDVSDERATMGLLARSFAVVGKTEVHNKTSYVDWRGVLVECGMTTAPIVP
jgi:SAM-dependent methyltransferase